MFRPLKAARVERGDHSEGDTPQPKRRRRPSSTATTTSSPSSTDAPGSKKRRTKDSSRGQQKARAPSSDIDTNDERKAVSATGFKWLPGTAASHNIMFTRYAEARTKSHRDRVRNMQPDQVACAHDQKAQRVWGEVKQAIKQLRENAAKARSAQVDDSSSGCIPSIPKQGWEEIEEARSDFFAANRGLRSAIRRHRQAQVAEQCSLDAAKALVGARRESEETLRLALAAAHPYWDLVRLRLAATLRQSIADTAAIVSLSKTVALSHASATAIADAKVTLLSRNKIACRYNREVTVCRVNGTGDSSTSGEGLPLRRQRLTSRDKVSVALPRTTTALDEPQASVPDPGVSPRMRVVLSQLQAIATDAAKRIADKNAITLQERKVSAGREINQ